MRGRGGGWRLGGERLRGGELRVPAQAQREPGEGGQNEGEARGELCMGTASSPSTPMQVVDH